MAISNPERHATEVAIFTFRAEAGLQQMREWLIARRDTINAKWPDLVGEELVRMQGEAKLVQKQLRMIENGPTIKEAA